MRRMHIAHVALAVMLAVCLGGCHQRASSSPTSDTGEDVAASSTGESYFLDSNELRQQVELAEQGDNRAALRVADHYGLGEAQPAKAYPWFLMAAKRGDIGAMRSLSVYLYAKGGRDNCKQAAQWIERARRRASPSEFQQHGLADTFNLEACVQDMMGSSESENNSRAPD